MEHTDDLFGPHGRVCVFLLSKAPDEDVRGDTNLLCNFVCLALKLWDGAFSDINQVDPGDGSGEKFVTQLRRKLMIQ